MYKRQRLYWLWSYNKKALNIDYSQTKIINFIIESYQLIKMYLWYVRKNPKICIYTRKCLDSFLQLLYSWKKKKLPFFGLLHLHLIVGPYEEMFPLEAFSTWKWMPSFIALTVFQKKVEPHEELLTLEDSPKIQKTVLHSEINSLKPEVKHL